MATPQVHADPLYQLLYNENIAEFNRRHEEAKSATLRGGVYRNLDLRNMNADGLDFGDAYFRGADLRGIDFRNANLEGASMIEAKISGCYFPKELSAEEIRLSVMAGTRLRYSK
jgi:uncharacterized protein YjbI with pentapeptide repeats